MKIAITTVGTDITSEVDQHFGRTHYFSLMDTDTKEWSIHDNKQNLNTAQGAGIQAAGTVIDLGAEAVISGNFGPKAVRVFAAGGVRMFLAEKGSHVEQVLEKFHAGTLTEASDATQEGHWV